MTADRSVLARLLAPLSVQGFLDDVWGAAPHHIGRNRVDYFTDLLAPIRIDGASVADALLTAMAVAPAAVRLVRGAEHADPAEHELPDGSVDVPRVRAAIDAGYTVILNNIERYLRPMTSLTHAIEVELNFPTHVNAYITPPHSVGFLPHYDHHDVLVLQVQGEKTWQFYGDAAVAPHRMQQLTEVDPAGLPAPTSLTVATGDTLYLPRGRVHSAATGAEPSVHLTVGIHVPTTLTLLTHALHLLSLRDDRVHTRLPARHLDDPAVRASLGDLLNEALAAVGEPAAVADGLGAMQDLLVRRGRCPVVAPASAAAGIDGQTVLVKHQPLYARVLPTADGVGLQFAQLLVSAGAEHEAAMRFLVAGTEPFRVGELPGLSPEQQIELARSLITSGFLSRPPADEV